MISLLWMAPAWAGDCAVARSAVELRAALDAAGSAWTSGDAPAFERYVGDARAILPCVAEPLAPPLVGAVHRVEGLASFAARDGAAARRAFAAARLADPAFPVDELAPAGTPLRAEWDAPAPPATTTPLAPPASGELRLDGVVADARPDERPVVFQVVDAQGRADSSAWLAVGAPTPAYAVRAPVRKAPVAAWIGAGAAAVGGGVLLGLAYAADEDYRASTTAGEAEERRATVNGLAAGGVGLGGVAVGLGVVALVGSF